MRLRWYVSPELCIYLNAEMACQTMLVCLLYKDDTRPIDKTQEIITGAVPYAECRTDAGVCAAILKKRFPKRPKELLGTGARETQMWELLKQCWDHDPEARPDASSALEFVSV